MGVFVCFVFVVCRCVFLFVFSVFHAFLKDSILKTYFQVYVDLAHSYRCQKYLFLEKLVLGFCLIPLFPSRPDLPVGNDQRGGGDPAGHREQRAHHLWEHAGDLRVP